MRFVLRFLSFDLFITPYLATWVWIIWNILFALGMAGMVFRLNAQPGSELLWAMYCLVNFLCSRVVVELIVVVFKIHERLTELRDQKQSRPPLNPGTRQSEPSPYRNEIPPEQSGMQSWGAQ